MVGSSAKSVGQNVTCRPQFRALESARLVPSPWKTGFPTEPTASTGAAWHESNEYENIRLSAGLEGLQYHALTPHNHPAAPQILLRSPISVRYAHADRAHGRAPSGPT